jgi:hypothetical protein
MAHGMVQETGNAARVLKKNCCSAAGPLPKLIAMAAASESFLMQSKLCSFFEWEEVEKPRFESFSRQDGENVSSTKSTE